MTNKQYRRKKAKKKNNKYIHFDEVFSYDNIIECAEKCKKGVMWRQSTQKMALKLSSVAYRIYESLRNDTYKLGKPRVRTLFERGHKRIVSSIRVSDRIALKTLAAKCLKPIFERTFIYDNCASQKGKGTHHCIRRVRTHLQKYFTEEGTNEGYILKFDFRHYYDSIPHSTIMNIMKEYIDDSRLLKFIYECITQGIEGDRGINLGSEVSQIVALLVGSVIDHLIKDILRVKHYVRYMDDGVIFCRSKKLLRKILKAIIEKARSIGLELNMKKTCISKIKNGFIFLKKKFSLSSTGAICIRVCRDTVTRMRRKLKKLKSKYNDTVIATRSFVAWLGGLVHYKACKTIASMTKLFVKLFGGEALCITN